MLYLQRPLTGDVFKCQFYEHAYFKKNLKTILYRITLCKNRRQNMKITIEELPKSRIAYFRNIGGIR